MANRTKVLDTLEKYFQTKGRVLNAQEYARETDTPIRLQQVRNIFGTWNKVEKLLMAREQDTDGQITDVDALIAERNKTQWEAIQLWKKAGENQDAKALREAEAQHVAEVLAVNAATANGANANKIAIGGKLPGEQQDFTAMGATVTTDPVTKEQTVVDTQPEIYKGEVTEDPRTPAELLAKVREDGVDTSDTDVGTATAGGSTGTPSVTEVAPLEKADKPADTPAAKSPATTDKK